MEKCRFDEDKAAFGQVADSFGITNFDKVIQENMSMCAQRMAYRAEKGQRVDYTCWQELRRDYHDWLIAVCAGNQEEIDRLAGLYIHASDED